MIALLNCSFRGKKSNSSYFLSLIEQNLEQPVIRIDMEQNKDMDTLVEQLKDVDTLVLSMPLYFDSIPSQVTEFFEMTYHHYKDRLKKMTVYAVGNCGFYESHQIHILLDIVKNWCLKMNYVYGGGLAIGGGSMLGSLRNVPLHKGPNQQLGTGILKLAAAIFAGTTIENIDVIPSYTPRFIYLFMANRGWKPLAKKNHLSARSLYHQET